MNDPGSLGAQWPYALATLLFAAGMWLLLPRGAHAGRKLGAGLTAAGLALLALLVHFGLTVLKGEPGGVMWTTSLPALGGWGEDGVFLALAAVTVGSAIGAVTFRSPVYCAIWFAMTLLGTAGLLLCQGAQFLGIATVVVYAGAILVTFLFVLMLAQPEGHAFYDRVSWEGPLSACAGAVMIGLLTMTLAAALTPPEKDAGGGPHGYWLESKLAVDRSQEILAGEHVASLGSQLFSTHLIAVEVAGTLLMVALVGAIAIVSHSQKLQATLGERTSGGDRMHEVHLLYDYLIVGALLFGIGLIGFLARRNMIVMFLAAEMMLQGVSISLVAWGRLHNNWGGQMLVIFILTVAACEAGIALALVLMLYQRSGRLDIAFWQNVREANQPAFVDQELPDDAHPKPVWPQLPPAGVEPEIDDEQLMELEQRPHV